MVCIHIPQSSANFSAYSPFSVFLIDLNFWFTVDDDDDISGVILGL
jgi:hypothetical protein